MKKSLVKTCSMVFAVVTFVALVVLICLSVSLPHTEQYRVWGTIYTEYYSGSFDTTYLSSMILLAFGTFWGLVIYFALPCEKCKKESKEEKVEEENAFCCCCSQDTSGSSQQ